LKSAKLLTDALKLNIPKEEIPADRAFELIILESIGRKAAKTALDWKKNIADYIVACRQDGGLPFFRLTYAGQPLATSDGRRVVLGVCLTATTSIMVDRFVYMPISKLYEKYISGRKINIMSYDFSRGAFIRTPILAAQKTKPNKILEIKLDKTKIKCSLDHPFFRKNQNGIELVNAADLNVGDLLPVLSNGDFYREFQIGGLFAGDGFIHREQEGYIKSISLSLLKEIAAFLEEIGIKTTINPVPLCKGHFGKKPIYKLYIPRIFMEKIKEWSKLPSKYDYLNSWLRGFYDAEGHITIYDKGGHHHIVIGLTNSEFELLSKIQKILRDIYGIKSTIIKDKRKNNLWQLLISRNLDAVKFSELIGFSHPEKREKLKRFLEEVLPKAQ